MRFMAGSPWGGVFIGALRSACICRQPSGAASKHTATTCRIRAAGIFIMLFSRDINREDHSEGPRLRIEELARQVRPPRRKIVVWLIVSLLRRGTRVVSKGFITLRGVEVHNLKHVDLDLPHRRLIVFCGVSGSGKSSLAFDTLYAEGQRRYIESFSAYTRQFLERLEKPAAERIDGIPPAVAVANKSPSRSSRSTVGTATETNDYLRLLFAKIGQVHCLKCGREVRRDSPQSAAAELARLPEGTRYLVAFPVALKPDEDFVSFAAALREEGFVRLICGERLLNLGEDDVEQASRLLGRRAASLQDTSGDACATDANQPIYVVVDRLAAGSATAERIRDSLETAFGKGGGRAFVFAEKSSPHPGPLPMGEGTDYRLEERMWRRIGFSTALACDDCQLEYPTPEPRLYSFNSPLGACPECEG